MNRFIPDWSMGDYYSQSKCEKVAFSYSVSKTIWQKSPLHAYHDHVRLGGGEKKTSESMSFGSAVHSAILGKGSEVIQSEYDDFRSKEAKEWKADREAEGKIILKQDDFIRVGEIRGAFTRQMRSMGLLSVFEASEREVMCEYEIDGVYAISMFDIWNENTPVIMDIKTIDCAAPHLLRNKIRSMSYDLQSLLYRKAAEIIRPDLAGRIRFLDLFIETEAPYCLVPAEIDGQGDYLAEMKLNSCLAKWKRGIDDGIWEGYVNSPIVLDTAGFEAKDTEMRV
jgi:hypothetical protein